MLKCSANSSSVVKFHICYYTLGDAVLLKETNVEHKLFNIRVAFILVVTCVAVN